MKCRQSTPVSRGRGEDEDTSSSGQLGRMAACLGPSRTMTSAVEVSRSRWVGLHHVPGARVHRGLGPPFQTRTLSIACGEIPPQWHREIDESL